MFGLCCRIAGRYKAPGECETYQSVRLLSDKVTHMREKGKKREYRKGAKVISWGPKARAANYFHCNLIYTLRRIDTNSAISNGLFDMPRPRESCVWVLKTGRVIDKETT